ncbi:MAG: hypothetical protein AUG11_02020, partial [Nitrospirae bacterium 13_1_20CM_2_62_14]
LEGDPVALARDLASLTKDEADARRCSSIREVLVGDGLYDGSPHGSSDSPLTQEAGQSWRIAPHPFLLSTSQVAFFHSLGQHLLAFYQALNRLYLESARGAEPAWVAAYLDQGKPDSLVSYSRMKRFRDLLPGVIRPDIIPTEDAPSGNGMVITELDSVPGGIGVTGALARAYSDFDIVGGPDGMVQGFARMLRHHLGERTGCVAIVVSDEAQDYRPEMAWVAARLQKEGIEAYCVHPREVRFTEETLLLARDGSDRPVSLVYRFFELFDLKNIPKSELIMYSAKKERTVVTPPFKPALEEKLAFALLHHPVLAPFWRRELGEATFDLLAGLMPRTWILDPRPVPPAAVIPDLRIGGRAVADWRDLAEASQRDRRYVVKPSGFSELAWGSRGVSVGHDLPQSEWAAALDAALASFPTTPSILQEFHKGRQFELSYFDERAGAVVPMSGRVRLSPYYFVIGERAELAGVLATLCPLDKKVIHGMRDAIMVPCAVAAQQ